MPAPMPVRPLAAPLAPARSLWNWALGWWRIAHFGAVVGVLALSPGSYSRPQQLAIARHVVLDTAPVLRWFTLMSSLLSLVIARIVVVTALSYGLTQYALAMVVRVLVVELIPLTAALFVAVRCTLPHGEALAALRSSGRWAQWQQQGHDPLRREVLPRALAGLFAVVMAAVLAGVVALVLAYLATYGFTLWALDSYTRTVGRVFTPTVVVLFTLKTLLFSLAVVLVPMGSALHDEARARGPGAHGEPPTAGISPEVRGLVRLFALLLLIEAASLAVNIL